mmetsp:Transcript_12449/g.30233  ORF Transcript_12449/g.30233 Transcript_12449/m.30233 type:complete len:340 (+) Transcript_12449:6929-7948(+)
MVDQIQVGLRRPRVVARGREVVQHARLVQSQLVGDLALVASGEVDRHVRGGKLAHRGQVRSERGDAEHDFQIQHVVRVALEGLLVAVAEDVHDFRDVLPRVRLLPEIVARRADIVRLVVRRVRDLAAGPGWEEALVGDGDPRDLEGLRDLAGELGRLRHLRHLFWQRDLHNVVARRRLLHQSHVVLALKLRDHGLANTLARGRLVRTHDVAVGRVRATDGAAVPRFPHGYWLQVDAHNVLRLDRVGRLRRELEQQLVGLRQLAQKVVPAQHLAAHRLRPARRGFVRGRVALHRLPVQRGDAPLDRLVRVHRHVVHRKDLQVLPVLLRCARLRARARDGG